MWDWTKDKLTKILETTPNQILDEWVTRPDFVIWPPKQRRAALWIIANFVDWRLRRDRTTTQDYYDFLRRAKWKAQQSPRWDARVGRYLSVNLEE
jgi:hypothetical protein